MLNYELKINPDSNNIGFRTSQRDMYYRIGGIYHENKKEKEFLVTLADEAVREKDSVLKDQKIIEILDRKQNELFKEFLRSPEKYINDIVTNESREDIIKEIFPWKYEFAKSI